VRCACGPKLERERSTDAGRTPPTSDELAVRIRLEEDLQPLGHPSNSLLQWRVSRGAGNPQERPAPSRQRREDSIHGGRMSTPQTAARRDRIKRDGTWAAFLSGRVRPRTMLMPWGIRFAAGGSAEPGACAAARFHRHCSTSVLCSQHQYSPAPPLRGNGTIGVGRPSETRSPCRSRSPLDAPARRCYAGRDSLPLQRALPGCRQRCSVS
jgi:hypothetical protein